MIAEGQRATTDAALELVGYALKSVDSRLAMLGYELSDLREAKDELLSEKAREEELEDYEEELSRLDPQKMQRLTSRLRPMVSEMALPLKRSADRIHISSGRKNKPISYLNEKIASKVNTKKFETEFIEIVGLIKSYDRLAGVGKVISDQLVRQLNFIVPVPDRRRLRDVILEAMKKDQVTLLCQQVTDGSGLPTSLVD